jgi:C4-dicarboxylate-specific signal transduction histidine kinase
VQDDQAQLEEQQSPNGQRRFSTYRILSGMKIRKKLIVLHTAFSLSLGVILLIAIQPAMAKVILGAEIDQGERLMELLLENQEVVEQLAKAQPESVRVRTGPQVVKGLPDQAIYQARMEPERSIHLASDGYAACVLRWMPQADEFVLIRAPSNKARDAIRLVYILVIATLIVGYGLVAAALELFVLPQHVYRPISAMLSADQAVSVGDRVHELIPESEIPADELGSIMCSRNDAIHALRTNERDLALALDRLEHTAADLHKKNHLLETARKNLEGADRLASLGMMSAGIAHELNTPLAVVKGLVEKLGRDGELGASEIALLTRVVRRLETLSDGLLDFARVRPPMNIRADVSELISESRTLVMLDRKEQIQRNQIRINDRTTSGTEICCDPDRLVQVFVNLIRNAVDALSDAEVADPAIEVEMEPEMRDSTPWVVVRVLDNGPGIDSALIDRLFEPFVSTRLDAQGTGLGLAVANGIVREHGGLLVATNRASQAAGSGAVFEVLLPMNRQGASHSQALENERVGHA